MGISNIRIAGRREEAWWEPTFAPSLEKSIVAHDWTFTNSTGPKNCFLSASSLKNKYPAGALVEFQGVVFENCDIQGFFEQKPAIVFSNCTFRLCDFAYSEWTTTIFRSVNFLNALLPWRPLRNANSETVSGAISVCRAARLTFTEPS